MKKIFVLILASSSLVSCMKEVDEIKVNNDFSSVAFINASPTNTAGATSGNVFVDNFVQSGTAVGYRGTTGYLSVKPGTRQVRYVSTATDSAKFVDLSAENFESGRAYTYIVYDTLAVGNRKLRSLRLTDDLTLPDSKVSLAKVRFLHLAPNGPAVDITFLRTNNPVGAPVADSVTITNRTYVGANPTQAQLDELSKFNIMLPLGFAGTYTVKVKAAGTQNLLVPATTVALTTNALNQSINTVYLTGSAQGQALGLGFFRHYP